MENRSGKNPSLSYIEGVRIKNARSREELKGQWVLKIDGPELPEYAYRPYNNGFVNHGSILDEAKKFNTQMEAEEFHRQYKLSDRFRAHQI